ncbi:MAG: hypothetical protein PHY43_13145 [Verrucomicrobiales bacterium]|nr:hypothetical protein [Verrucomicrobiales bacterium]
MKAKTLLIAAAALAATVISSQAQVYSANIVGYVNISIPKTTFALISNPLDNGTNTANDLLAALPNKSSIQLWNGTGFTTYGKTSSGFTPSNPSIPVGQGFFVSAAAAYTNTFVGTVVPSPGGSATNAIPKTSFVLVGSTLPVSGTFNDVGNNTLNLAATLPNKSTVQLWNGTGFTTYGKTSSGFTPSNPAYTVGQGFFISSAAATNWVQTLVP